MITIMFHMTVKAGREQEFERLAQWLAESSRTEDLGCIAYVFHRQVDVPREYVLYEQWRDEDALDAHVARLQAAMGPPPSGGRAPAALLDFFERTRGVRYGVIA